MPFKFNLKHNYCLICQKEERGELKVGHLSQLQFCGRRQKLP